MNPFDIFGKRRNRNTNELEGKYQFMAMPTKVKKKPRFQWMTMKRNDKKKRKDVNLNFQRELSEKWERIIRKEIEDRKTEKEQDDKTIKDLRIYKTKLTDDFLKMEEDLIKKTKETVAQEQQNCENKIKELNE